MVLCMGIRGSKLLQSKTPGGEVGGSVVRKQASERELGEEPEASNVGLLSGAFGATGAAHSGIHSAKEAGTCHKEQSPKRFATHQA